MYEEQPGHPLSDVDYAEVLAQVLRLAITPGPGGSRIVPVTVDLPFMGDVGIRLTCAIAALWPSSQIVAHRDAPIVGTRVHMPLQTNPDCWSFHDGVWQHLDVGRGYEMDPTGWHGAVNWGTEVRLHLVVDVLNAPA